MENSLNTLTSELLLRQSELFGDDYKEAEIKHIHTFNDLSVSDLEDWYNSILTKYAFLNEIQIKNFHAFVSKLNFVLTQIDPKKLKINDDCVENVDLILWRESENGMSMITFDEYGQFAYNFIGKNGRKIKGVFDSNVDVEKLLFKFISM